MEQAIFQIIVNGGAFALAVWLIFDTRREAQQREARLVEESDRREARLLAIIEGLTCKLEIVTRALDAIDRRLAQWEE